MLSAKKIGALKGALRAISVAAVGATAFLFGSSSIFVPRASLAAPVSCGNEYAQNAFNYLRSNLGYTPSSYWCRMIDANSTDALYITFNGPGRSAFVAECDEDCRDIDIYVYCNGQLIGADTSSSSYARVDVAAVVGEEYEVVVSMHDCSTGNCAAVVGTL